MNRNKTLPAILALVLIALVALIGIANYLGRSKSSNEQSTPTPSVSVTATPSPTATSGAGLSTIVKLAYLNPDGTLPNEAKPGDISGCDHVTLKERQIAPTATPLTAALQLLLQDKTVWSTDRKIYNYVGQANLKLDSAMVQNGVAKINLSGTVPPLGGVCDDPRLFVQIAQTARQFPTVQTVELYVNGARNTGAGNER